MYYSIPMIDGGHVWEFEHRVYNEGAREWDTAGNATVVDHNTGLVGFQMHNASVHGFFHMRVGYVPRNTDVKKLVNDLKKQDGALKPNPDDVSFKETGFSCTHGSVGNVKCGAYAEGNTLTVNSGDKGTSSWELKGEVEARFNYNSGVLANVIAKMSTMVGVKISGSTGGSYEVENSHGVTQTIVAGTVVADECFSGEYHHKYLWVTTTVCYKGTPLGSITRRTGGNPCLYLVADQNCQPKNKSCEGVTGSYVSDGLCGWTPPGGPCE